MTEMDRTTNIVVLVLAASNDDAAVGWHNENLVPPQEAERTRKKRLPKRKMRLKRSC
jgi:hypothetical protein